MGIGDWGLGIGDWGLGIGRAGPSAQRCTHRQGPPGCRGACGLR